nr:histidine kinase [Marichromatium bheemlicum]
MFLALSYVPLWILLQQTPGWPAGPLCAPEAALTLAAVMLGGVRALLLPLLATLVTALLSSAETNLVATLAPLPLYGALGYWLSQGRSSPTPSITALLTIAATALVATAVQAPFLPDTEARPPGEAGAIFISLLVTAALLSLRQHRRSPRQPLPSLREAMQATLGLALLLALLATPLAGHDLLALAPAAMLLTLPLAVVLGAALGPRTTLVLLCVLELLTLFAIGLLGTPTLTPLYQVLLVLIGIALPLAVAQVRLRGETNETMRDLVRRFDHERVTQGEEAHRLARTLHDDPMQLLTAAALTTQRLARDSDTASQQTLHRVYQLINDAIGSMRAVCARLSPPLLYEFGLAEALSRLVLVETSAGRPPPSLELEAGPAITTRRTRLLMFDTLSTLLEHYPLARIRFTDAPRGGLEISLVIAAPATANALPGTTLGQLLELRLQALGGTLLVEDGGQLIRVELPPQALTDGDKDGGG